MRSPRFRIRTLMAAVTVSAVSLVAIRNPTKLSATIVFHAVLALLIVGSYQAKRASGIRALAWTGFTAFGWTQLFFGYIPDSSAFTAPRLFTDAAIAPIVGALEPRGVPIALDTRVAMIWTVRSLLSLPAGLVGAALFALVAAIGGRLTNPEDGIGYRYDPALANPPAQG